ncbi:MAG: hypothetical protein H7Z70_01040 [Bacteroidia bacterium]|nr:hypothetical protein [Methylotenera sp.]
MTQFFSIAWRILVHLATGSVILAMFHIANSPFENIVISALVLIYVSVSGSYMALSYTLFKKWDIDLTRYIAIANSLHLNTEIETEAKKENQEDAQKGQTVFWITSRFNMLFWLIAVGNLLYAIKS